jgi:hypothetical protein
MVGLDLERLHPGDAFFAAKAVQARARAATAARGARA